MTSQSRQLHNRITHGWVKYTDRIGQNVVVGEPPYFDLYRVVHSLYRPGPVPDEAGDVYLGLAATIKRLYPDRITTAEIGTSYDARICVMEFNDHVATSLADILRVIDEVSAERG
jgi:hypothetical protein